MGRLVSPFLRPISLEDQEMVDTILSREGNILSPYTFPFHYVWRDIFEFSYSLIDGHFCMFAKYGKYIHMPLPPLPVENNNSYRRLLVDLFDFMDKINNNTPASRIENLYIPLLIEGMGLSYLDREYIYLRKDIIELRGNRFKSKRSLYNFFIKNYHFQYEDITPGHMDECLDLFERWKHQKLSTNRDKYFQSLIEDTFIMHRRALKDLEKLNLSGKVIRINGYVEGYIVGYIRGQTLYILLEICNPSIKGLSTFIFRKYCEEMNGAIYVNSLGDSGIEGLKKAKLFYKPISTPFLYGLYRN